MKKFLSVNYQWMIGAMLAVNLLFAGQVALAQTQLDVWGDEITQTRNLGYNALNDVGLGNRDPRRIATSVIQVMLGFLGVIAVCLILFGGFKYMTSQGSDEKTKEAGKLMTAGVIGLLIVLAAFAVSIFVLNALMGATSGIGNYTPIGQNT